MIISLRNERDSKSISSFAKYNVSRYNYTKKSPKGSSLRVKVGPASGWLKRRVLDIVHHFQERSWHSC